MLNTESMLVVDLNADLAEGDRLTDGDLGVLDAVTSASLACGYHAGGPDVMRSTAAACVARGVTIGAHVSFRDRQGFGRRALTTPPAALTRDIVDQWTALTEQVGAAGGVVSFVKPHGALYHQMGVDPAVATAVVDALGRIGAAALVAQGGTVVATLAARAGLRVVPEGFPDRAYLPDGRLAPRTEPGALVEDPLEAGRRAVSLARRGGTEALDGTWTAVEVETLCIHGDGARAAESARAVRRALEADGIRVRSFSAPAPGGRPP
jgi:5-oxoprolinase (ATP-hydrolysing) subunit A